MKVYISGAITGRKHYRDAFARVERKLRRLGHVVMNPAVLPAGFSYDEYMKICYAMMEACEAIYMIPGWKASKGACAEKEYAKRRGMKVCLTLPGKEGAENE